MNLLEQALSYYFDHYSDLVQLKSGHTNKSYIFVSTGKKYLLRFYTQDAKNPRTAESIKLEIDLMKLFGSQGIPTTNIIPNKQGLLLSKIDQQFFDVFEFIEGKKVYGELKNTYFKQVGATMATMHQITQTKNLQTEIRWPEGNFWTHVLQIADQNQNLLTSEDLSITENLKSLKEYLIHGDFHFGNLLFRDHKLVGVLDFDHYRMGHFIDDITRSFVAEMAHTTKADYWLTQEFVDYFWDGYLKNRQLTTLELNLLLPYIDLHYLNQLTRLEKEDRPKVTEFKQQVVELKQFTSRRLKLN